MSKFPVFDHVIRRGEKFSDFNRIGLGYEDAVIDDDVRHEAKKLPLFHVDSNLHESVKFKPKSVDINRDFGPLMPPFPETWIEWSNERPDANGARDPWPTAMKVTLIDRRDHPVMFDQAIIEPWIWPPGRPIPMKPASVLRIAFNSDGSNRAVNLAEAPEVKMMRAMKHQAFAKKTEVDDLVSLIDLVWDGLLALGFVNCKNVKVETRSATVGRKRRRSGRRNVATLEYRTIVLPGRESGGSEPTGEHAGTMPHHKVRGHFKTYTEDAPLMGKFTGTYWWGWQVRGKKGNGIVVADYEVGAA